MIEDAGISVREIGRGDEAVWNELLHTAVNGSYRQSMGCEYARAFEGWQIHSFAFYRDGKPIAGVHYALRQSPLGPVADATAGFVHKDEPEPDLYQRLVEHFVDWAGERNSSLIRLTTWLPKSVGGHLTPYSSWVPHMMKTMGFKVFRPPRHTYWIDLTQDEERLLARMRKKTRQHIHKAERMGLTVEEHRDANPEALERFFQLYARLGERKGIDNFCGRERLMATIVPLLNSRLAILFLARYEGKVLSGTVVSCFGEAADLYTAMDPDIAKDRNFPSPGHKLSWEVSRTLKEMGLRIHDMGFCPGPVPVSGHPLYGIWSFKYGFRGDHVEFLPPYCRVLKRSRGSLLSFALKLRRHLVGM